MSRIKWTEKKIAERQKAGYGEGSGSAYNPWLEVFDLSSTGRSRRVWSSKTGRAHHLFSDVEHDIFIAAEWSRSVIDIREQYPLDREITQTIAHDLKIRHPHYPGTQVPTVMTVDFLLTVRTADGEDYIALNAKRDEEAEDETSLEKLEIQRSYFQALGIPHHLIYHSRIPKQKIANIYWIRDAQLKTGETEPHAGFYDQLKSRMAGELASYDASDDSPLAAYCASFDMRYGVEPGTGLRIARMLMQERALLANLNSPNLANDPVGSFLMTSRAGRLRAVGGKNAV
jgi:hypothetical protein